VSILCNIYLVIIVCHELICFTYRYLWTS